MGPQMQPPAGQQMQPPAGQQMQPPGQQMQPSMAPQAQPSMVDQGGHLYMQTNEVRNCIIHYFRAPNGAITEVERFFTGGAGSGGYKPVSGEESAANDFEGANSVILTPDRRFLFTTNGGDNSVSSFAVGADGKLVLLDAKRTGNIVAGRSGTAKALQYSPAHKMLYVLHSFGPDHLRLMSVDDEGNLTPRPERYTVALPDKPRVATMAALTPDEKFLVVGTTFDVPVEPFPDGSPNLWVERNGVLHSRASNNPDPDGAIVFPVASHGTLGEPKFQDGGGGSPWYYLFLRHRPDTFVLGYAVGDGVALGRIDEDGNISVGPITQVNTFRGKPTELCWLSATPDDRMVFSTEFGYGYLTSYRIDGNVISIARDPACPQVPGDGTWRGALNGNISSGPSDSWICPTGSFLYQIYGNASKLCGYAIHPDGSLEEITSASIPYNSPQGLAGW
jgi:6-phosphogluconolactonase (cycloisomerase 2 family)